MSHTCARLCLALCPLVAATPFGTADAADVDWPQWGGPNRNFTVNAKGLAEAWPRGGPPRLWRRELGDGYSGVVATSHRLYTLYRKAPDYSQEYVGCLDARTGETIWEHAYPAPPGAAPDYSSWGGGGPNATPLLAGDRLFTIGSRMMMHCWNPTTGDVLWKHDLHARYRGTASGEDQGYCPSPIAYKDLVIVIVGRLESETEQKGRSLVAFDQQSGRVVWESQDFVAGASSPILIRFAGRDQIVVFVPDHLLGVDPTDGSLLWQYDYPMRYRTTVVTPVWNGENLLFCRACGQAPEGTSTIKLSEQDGRIIAEELWSSTKLPMFVPTPVPIGEHLYGSLDQVLVAVDFKTGERKWVRRGFPCASCIHADGKLISLDENGKLTLSRATPQGLTILAQHQATERYSFTVPALVGTTLYVRDRKHIMALDLGEQ